MMGFSIAFIIIVLIVLYSLARTAGESDRILENIREQVQAAGGIIVTVDDGRLAMQLRGF